VGFAAAEPGYDPVDALFVDEIREEARREAPRGESVPPL